jgi:hypothetical protein
LGTWWWKRAGNDTGEDTGEDTGDDVGADRSRSSASAVAQSRASSAARRSVVRSMAMQVQSAATESVIASRPGLVIAKSRKIPVSMQAGFQVPRVQSKGVTCPRV